LRGTPLIRGDVGGRKRRRKERRTGEDYGTIGFNGRKKSETLTMFSGGGGERIEKRRFRKGYADRKRKSTAGFEVSSQRGGDPSGRELCQGGEERAD